MNRNSLNAACALFAAIIVAVPYKAANAGIDAVASLFITTTWVSGTCFFGITENEPYAAMNADCELVKDDAGGSEIQLDYIPLSAFQIGYPRTEYESWHWNPVYAGTVDPETQHCTFSGSEHFREMHRQ